MNYARGLVVIGVGIIGCNYGKTVLIPAFRSHQRCEVVALAGSDTARTEELARAANVARGFGNWRALVEQDDVAVVAIAVPPDLQPAIAQYALELGKPVFLEKPLAANVTNTPHFNNPNSNISNANFLVVTSAFGACEN